MSWTVTSEPTDPGPVVRILDPDGAERLRRVCRTQEEGEVFASTVRQHLAWLSEERFKEYYRL